MGWLFEKLVELAVEGLSILLSIFVMTLVGVFKLDGNQTLKYFFDTFQGEAERGILSQAYRMFLYCGYAIIFLNLLYQIFKAFFGPMVQAESPTKVVGKSMFIALLITFAQNIVALVFDITTIPYKALTANLTVDSAWVMEKITNNISKNWKISDVNVADIANVSLIVSPAFWISVVCIVLFFLLLKQFIQLSLEMAERYLMLGLLTIIAPLCIACGAIRGLEDVFKNWLSWIFNGCITLIFTTFFLSVFITSFTASVDIPSLLLWICWFKVGQKIDEHMNALGLKTAKTGGFGQDVMGAMIAGLPAALRIGNKVTGRNFGIPGMSGARSGKVDPNKKTSFFNDILGQKDPRTGEKRNGLTGLSNKIMSNANQKIADGAIGKTIAKGEIGAANALNNLKEKITGEGSHGTASSLSHQQIQDMLSGKTNMPKIGTPEYNNIMKDAAEMKMGSDLLGNLEKDGNKLTAMNTDKDGNTTFKFEDENGNKCIMQSYENPELAPGSKEIEGTDGEKRGLVANVNEDPENPMNLSAYTGFDNDSKNNMVGISSALGDGDMQENGIVENNSIQASAENVPNISQEAANLIASSPDGNIAIATSGLDDQGKLKSFDIDGNESSEGGFIKAEDKNGGEVMVPKEALKTPLSGGDGDTPIFNKNIESNPIVKTLDGDYVRSSGNQRYDSNGNLDANGTHMKIPNNQGFTELTPVESFKAQNGYNQIPTYSINNNASIARISDSDKNNNNYQEKISYDLKRASGSDDISYMQAGKNVFSVPSNSCAVDSNGNSCLQQYVKGTNGKEYAVDMSQVKLSKEGRIIPDEQGHIPVVSSTGTSSFHVSNFAGFSEDKQTNRPACNSYVKYNNDNGTVADYNVSETKIVPLSKTEESYYNGVPTNIDLNKAKFHRETDNNNLYTGRDIMEYNGANYSAVPVNSVFDISDAKGAIMDFNGKKMMVEPLSSGHYQQSISALDLKVGSKDQFISKNNESFSDFARTFGIPSNADEIKYSSSRAGSSCITYKHDGKIYAITPTSVSDQQEPIISKRTLSSGKTEDVIIGYKSLLKNTSVPVKIAPKYDINSSRVRNRAFKRSAKGEIKEQEQKQKHK